MFRSKLLLAIAGASLGALMISSCGTGQIGGTALFGDYIPSPPGPRNNLYGYADGQYVAVVEQPLVEHQVDDDFFFLSANNWTVGDTSLLRFSQTGKMVDHPYITAEARATGGLQFTVNSATSWVAKEPPAGVEFLYTAHAPYPDIHSNGVYQDFYNWHLTHSWLADIIQDRYIDLKLMGLATSSNSSEFVGIDIGFGWGANWSGLGDLVAQGNATLYELNQRCHPRPTGTELGPYAGTYSVQGRYQGSSAEGWTSDVTFSFNLSSDGVVNSNLTQVPILCYIFQGTFGSSIVGQRSGPAIQTADNAYYPAVPPSPSDVFTFTRPPNAFDKVTQNWTLIVSAAESRVNGGAFQQSLNAFPPDTELHDREVILGARIAFQDVGKN